MLGILMSIMIIIGIINGYASVSSTCNLYTN